MRKMLINFCALTLALGVSLPVAAALPSKMFRLHLDVPVVEVGTGEVDPDGPAGNDHYGGLAMGVNAGKGGIGFGFTLGRGFVLGGKLTLAQETNNWHPGGENEWLVWGMVPYLEYVFLNGLFRPFVKVHSGFEGIVDNNYDFWGFIIGGGGGAHLFIHPNVSLDIILDLTGRIGTGDWNADGPGGGFHHWRFSFGILFGLSGWF